jgi:hypothetical protein
VVEEAFVFEEEFGDNSPGSNNVHRPKIGGKHL